MKLPTILLALLAAGAATAATPIKDAVLTGAAQQTGGAFTIQTGVAWTWAGGSTLTIASGATLDASAGTLTLADGQIGWAKVAKTGSSLADLATRSAGDLSSGTLPDARFPATLPAASGANLTALTGGNILWADGVRITFNPDAASAGLNVGGLAGDPSTPSNGDLWYDSTANELTARINGANVALGGGGGGSDPSTTKGDLLARSASALARLPVGANTYVLTADSAETLGVKWAAAGAGVGSFTSLTDGATITWTVDSTKAVQNATVTLGGNRTLAFSGAANGMTGVLIVKQDATGSRTLTLPGASKVISNGVGAVTLTTTANAIDILTWVFDGTNYFWTHGKNYN